MSTFPGALAKWKDAAAQALDLKITYEAAYATAVVNADGKNAEARKAQADGQSLASLQAWKHAEIEADAAWALVQYLTAQAGRVAS